jgi:ribosome production factor 1
MFKSPTSAKLQEIGPRFTLKLRWLRKGLPAVGAADGVAPTNAGDSDEEVDEEDNEEIGDEAMNDGMEVDPREEDESDAEAGEPEDTDKGKKGVDKSKKGVGKAKGGRRIPALDEHQEYEWKWKVSLAVHQYAHRCRTLIASLHSK